MARIRQNGSLMQTMFAVRQGVPPAPPSRGKCRPLDNPPAKGTIPLTPPTVRRLDTRRGIAPPAPRLGGIIYQVIAKPPCGLLPSLRNG